MNAGRRPEGAASDAAGRPAPILAHIGPPCGCPRRGVHECGVGAPIRPSSSCPLCSTLGVRELQVMGWRYGGCVHLAGAA